MSSQTIEEPAMKLKPFEAGSGIEFKELDDKILITGQSRTLIKEGHFTLDAEIIHIIAGPGIKISSKGKDTLVISCDQSKMEESFFDLQQTVDKRLEVIEKILSKIVKDAKK